jgi:hypothetical protein
MDQCPCLETNPGPANQEIPSVLRNPKAHFRVHKSPTLILILSQINPDHALLLSPFMIRFNIILLPTPRSSKTSLFFMLSTNIFYTFLKSPMRSAWPGYVILLDLIVLKQLVKNRHTNYEAPNYDVCCGIHIPIAKNNTNIQIKHLIKL